MSIDFVFRIVGMLAFGFGGWQLGTALAGDADSTRLRYVLVVGLAGGALGLLLTPYLTTRPFRRLWRLVKGVPVPDLVASVIGLFVGLIIAALAALPLSMLPAPIGGILPFLVAILFGYLGVAVLVMRKREIFDFFSSRRAALGEGQRRTAESDHSVLVDTSAIIDGRIADIVQTGFIEGTLVVPRFVLSELQNIADSSDSLRRNRGRRGLDMLNRLQKESLAPVQISELDAPDAHDVDSKLVRLAKTHRYAIITNDFNLNRVAGLQGVRVLNVNELANAVKPMVLPGEEMVVRVIQEGKELGQGVGYLDDGTMIVIENGRKRINNDADVVVTRVLQTAAGRMIFAHLKN